jgi:hypothetical protein
MKTNRGRRQRSSRGHWDCPSGKRRYRDHEHAVHALWFAKSDRRRADEDGVGTARHERRTYFCGMCKGHHLTSQVLYEVDRQDIAVGA